MSNERLVYAVVPVKDPAQGKSRLASVLGAADRRALCASLARHALRTCAAAFGAGRTVVVTASSEIARMAELAGIVVVREDQPASCLNTALVQGAARAIQAGAQALLIVPTDLPLVTREGLRSVAAEIPAAPGVVLVPDRRRTGTNMMGLSPARGDLFAFGEGSLERHADLARRAQCDLRIFTDDALGLDLDVAEDYFAWQEGRGMPKAGLAA